MRKIYANWSIIDVFEFEDGTTDEEIQKLFETMRDNIEDLLCQEYPQYTLGVAVEEWN